MPRAILLLTLAVWAAVPAQGADGQPAGAVNVPPADSATVLRLTLRADAVCAGELVLLSEVAELPPALEALKSIEIGRNPSPGQNRSLSRTEIAAALRRAGQPGPVEFAGAPSVRVTAESQRIAPEQIVDAAKGAILQAAAAEKDVEIEIDAVGMPKEVFLRPGPVTLDADLPVGGLRPGLQSVKVRVAQLGGRESEVNVSLRVRIAATIHVAAERIAAGDALTPELLKSVRKELSLAEFQSRCDATRLAGMRARAPIPAGQMLLRSQFTPPSVIRRGEGVTLVVRRGALELTASGEARADAALGESVRIRVLDTNAEVVARATGPREAVIDDK